MASTAIQYYNAKSKNRKRVKGRKLAHSPQLLFVRNCEEHIESKWRMTQLGLMKGGDPMFAHSKCSWQHRTYVSDWYKKQATALLFKFMERCLFLGLFSWEQNKSVCEWLQYFILIYETLHKRHLVNFFVFCMCLECHSVCQFISAKSLSAKNKKSLVSWQSHVFEANVREPTWRSVMPLSFEHAPFFFMYG